MNKINYKNYFDVEKEVKLLGNIGYYVDPIKMDTVLTCEIQMDTSDIKEFLDSCVVNVSEEEIRNYLNKKLEEENPGLKERLEEYKRKNSDKGIIDSETAVQRFMDSLEYEKYQYSKREFNTLINYINIVKTRTTKLVDVVSKIINHETSDDEFKEILLDLDIKMEGNFIYYEDIKRLLTPLIFNVKDLKETVNIANNLDTYLNYREVTKNLNINHACSYETGVKDTLQIKNTLFGNIPGYVPITKNQAEMINNKNNKVYRKIIKMVEDL